MSLLQVDPTDATVRTEADTSAEFSRQLEAVPLRYAFQDGRVEHLCASEESAWVLNIKRGVLSAFQNSMEHFENDHTVSEVNKVLKEIFKSLFEQRHIKKVYVIFFLICVYW